MFVSCNLLLLKTEVTKFFCFLFMSFSSLKTKKQKKNKKTKKKTKTKNKRNYKKIISAKPWPLEEEGLLFGLAGR